MADDERIKKPPGSGEPKSPTPHNRALTPSAQAQAVSINHDRQPVRPRDNMTNTMNLNDIFAPRRFTRFYTIKSTGDANLTKLNICLLYTSDAADE